VNEFIDDFSFPLLRSPYMLWLGRFVRKGMFLARQNMCG